mmetsp:Transcript_16267/g.39328  ORF Transcript_16267/g.39328 Transcript_16267/m.39328 type:complete len:316 (+) Transcript_16267:62-1009(+)
MAEQQQPAPERKAAVPGGDPPSSWFDAFCNPARACRACLGEFKQDASLMSLFGESEANASWAERFGTSPCFSADGNMILYLRGVFALFFLGHLPPHMAKWMNEGFYFIYLTNLTWLLEQVYFTLAFIVTYQARQRLQNQVKYTVTPGPCRLPVIVRITWMLMHLCLPASLLVMLMYWTLVNPFWNMNTNPDYFGYIVHGVNFVFCLLDFMLSRNLFRLRYMWITIAYAVLYTFWSWVHHAAKVGTYEPCDDVDDPGEGLYPREECPIYGTLDWHKAGGAFIMSALVVVCLVPMCHIPIFCCQHTRQQVDLKLQNV